MHHLTEKNITETLVSGEQPAKPLEKSDSDSDQQLAAVPVGFDDLATKRLVRKIDYNLIPLLALLYLLSFLDRTNIGNARLAEPGLEKSLGLQGVMYNVAVSIFFPFYVAAEIPSNLMMKATRPSLWIPFIMIVWGICCICMGLVTNYAGLLATRAALGIAEGGLFPGATYFISLWYRRHECGLRMALFYSAATAAGAFGGLLARGIMEMEGVGGKHGWAWIFIIEGLITFLVGIVAFFAMHDYADTAKFLKPDERTEVLRRLKDDRSSLADEFNLKYFWDAIYDKKIWVHMFITIGIYTPLYSISIFLPTIVKNLGYTDPKLVQLMTVPPYAVAAVFCIGGGFAADKSQQRGVYMIGFCLMAIMGFAMLLGSTSLPVRYAGTFFATSGIYANVPHGVAWNANNIGGSTKRGVGIAMHVGWGNLGGAIAGFVYAGSDNRGHAVLIGFIGMSMILSICMTTFLRRENARRDREYKSPDLYTEEEKALEREKGDFATFFRYTV